MHQLTAAHRTLPLGSTVRVTNLKNRKSAQLRINDRGPGPARRLIDISWEAAKRLGFLTVGLTMVQVEVVRYPKDYFPQSACLHPPQLN